MFFIANCSSCISTKKQFSHELSLPARIKAEGLPVTRSSVQIMKGKVERHIQELSSVSPAAKSGPREAGRQGVEAEAVRRLTKQQRAKVTKQLGSLQQPRRELTMVSQNS